MKSNRVIKVFSKNKILKKEFIRENKKISSFYCDHSYDFGNGWLRQNY